MMRRVFLPFFLTFLHFIAFTQNSKWESFIEQKTSESEMSFLMAELNKEEMAELRRKGMRPVRKVDESHFIFKKEDIITQNENTWTINDQWKLNLSSSVLRGRSLFYVKTIAPLSFKNLPSSIQIVSSQSNIYLVECWNRDLEVLISRPEVTYISNEANVPKVEARVIDLNINPNRVNKVHDLYPSINGTGETVSIKEDKFNPQDIDLRGRYVESNLASEMLDQHASEMATIVAGTGNSFVTGEGVAKNAFIASSNFFPVLPDDDDSYRDLDINTQNHSYGTLIEQFYGAQANAFDQSAVNNPNLLHVFSIGNQGFVVDTIGVYKGIEGYANMTGNYKMSKNTISVGSVDTVGREITFVSRGPAYDGRVKPEVVAYSQVGSSNSAALVSGVSILLQQYYREAYSNDMPSALVKALLINGADDVGAKGLDFISGYGNVNAFKSLRALQEDRFFSGTVSQNEVDQILLTIPENAVNLKMTIAWTDLPANPNDAVALVNDLDLRLIDGAMSATLPWVLDSSPTKEALESPAQRRVDRLNNVEQITIEHPEESYTIEVEGFSVSGSQEYFVAYQFDTQDTFEWDYPTGSDNMPYNGESGSYFRWNTTFDGVGELSYSLDEGNSWLLLDNQVDLSKEYWRWSSIPDLSTRALARMTIGTNVFQSENFSISRPFRSRVGFNCTDSVMIRWPVIPNAESYTIFKLGEVSLEEITTTTDTSLIINNKDEIIDQRLSVRPNVAGGPLLRSPTFDFSLQGVDCYVMSFFQEIALDTGIYLNLDLGTSYGIEELKFYRLEGTNRVEVGEVINPERDGIRLLDLQPNQGYNEHIVSIKFQNGEEIEMSSGISSYVTEIPILLFPNVILEGESVTVLMREFESQNPVLKVFDMKGSEALLEVQITTQEVIPLDLRKGIYIYRLEDGSVNSTGRIIVK